MATSRTHILPMPEPCALRREAAAAYGERPVMPPYRWPAAPVTLSAERNAKA